jgi:hypothetical protein
VGVIGRADGKIMECLDGWQRLDSFEYIAIVGSLDLQGTYGLAGCRSQSTWLDLASPGRMWLRVQSVIRVAAREANRPPMVITHFGQPIAAPHIIAAERRQHCGLVDCFGEVPYYMVRIKFFRKENPWRRQH